MKTEIEFWAMVDQWGPTECWPYKGARKRAIPRGPRDEYGMVMWRGHIAHAHRVALLLTKGEPPEGKTHALHSCDNPPCCNPAHLEWGSAQDNMDQMASRGRRRSPRHHGERNGRAKLTWEIVQAIRLAPSSLTQAYLASWFGVSPGAVSKIRTGRTWKQP